MTGKACMECGKIGHFQKVCNSRNNRVVIEKEQEVSHEYTEDNLEMLSINSVCLNKNQLMLTAKSDTCVGSNNMIIPYKIDTGSDGNIMPWYIFIKLFSRVTESQLTKPLKSHKIKNI